MIKIRSVRLSVYFPEELFLVTNIKSPTGREMRINIYLLPGLSHRMRYRRYYSLFEVTVARTSKIMVFAQHAHTLT